jgi:hypothetical protein
MHLYADMVRDQPHDPLGVGWRNPVAADCRLVSRRSLA